MTSYYENEKEFDKRGIDYDLAACLRFNAPGIEVKDIKKVHAVHEGEGDADSWGWVLSLKDGRKGYLTGWCDYIGWDCQSGAEFTPAKTLRAAALLETDANTQSELLAQLKSRGKSQAGREGKDEEFGL